jgi:hypothetical protein
LVRRRSSSAGNCRYSMDFVRCFARPQVHATRLGAEDRLKRRRMGGGDVSYELRDCARRVA